MRNLAPLLQLLLVIIALSFILLGPSLTRRWVAAGIKLVGRAAFGAFLVAGFTVTDAIITTSLSAYQAATGRPHLVPETWHQFALRFNDRVFKWVVSEQ